MLFPPRYIPPLGPGKISSRDRALAQWRGTDIAPLEKARIVAAKSISALVPKILKDLRIDKRRAEAEMLKVWNTTLEPEIVSHSQPTGFRNGTLFVTVDSNVWLSEIVRYRRKEILDRMQHSFGRGVILRISFRLG